MHVFNEFLTESINYVPWECLGLIWTTFGGILLQFRNSAERV